MYDLHNFSYNTILYNPEQSFGSQLKQMFIIIEVNTDLLKKTWEKIKIKTFSKTCDPYTTLNNFSLFLPRPFHYLIVI